MKKNIVILGATGFIGKAVVRYLKDKSVNLYLASFHGGSLDHTPVQALDLTKKSQLSIWLDKKKIDSLFYLSALIPGPAIEMNSEMYDVNMKMHQEVLSYWLKTRCHLLYASSFAVYRSQSQNPSRESNAVFPTSHYAISKLMGEHLFLMEFLNTGLPLSVLRISAPYGYKEDKKTVVNIFMEQALQGKPLTLMGTGKRTQDFIYVEDVARAFWLANTKKKYGLFNIASGQSVTMKTLAKTIIEITQSVSKIIYTGHPDSQEERKIHISINRAKKELQFFCRYNLEQGLKAMAQDYRKEQLLK